MKPITFYQESINYSYIAPEKRKMVILGNMNRLQKGMPINEVVQILNHPDEIHATFKGIKFKSNKKIGFSLTYLLDRKQPSGSVNQKAEKLLKIHFNNEELLVWAFTINIDGFDKIEHLLC